MTNARIGSTTSTEQPLFGRRLGLLLLPIAVSQFPAAALAQAFSAISAGDMTDRSAVLWTQIRQGSGEQQYTSATGRFLVKVEVADNPGNFASGFVRYVATTPENGSALKTIVTGLLPNKAYFYRFSVGGVVSETGRFFTTPAPSSIAPLKIGFTGDYDAKYRPYSVLNRFGQQPGAAGINYFVNLGDIIYEREAKGSPALPNLEPSTPAIVLQQSLNPFYRKYMEGVSGVDTATGKMTTDPTKQQGSKNMLASTGVYTLLDNHELYNAMISGGAPQNSQKENFLCDEVQPPTPCLQSASNTGPNATFINQTTSFKTMEKTFFNTQSTAAQVEGLPMRGLTIVNQAGFAPVVNTAGDPRTDGTALNFFTRSWGRHAVYIQLDDRSYRDARMVNTGPRIADDPKRTMLGRAQLDWFKQQLLAAQRAGFVWKVVAISTPIDIWTDPDGKLDNKSWIAGYNFERNDIMKFIVDNKIRNVVFITTDEHIARATWLTYQPGGVNSGSPNGWAAVSNAFQLLAGPAGAVGPFQNAEEYKSFGIDASRKMAAVKNREIVPRGALPIGLKGFPGLSRVYREEDPNANTNRDSVDFISGTTFNYATLAWDMSSNLRVEFWGIDGYAPDSYPSVTKAPRKLFAFSVAPLR